MVTVTPESVPVAVVAANQKRHRQPQHLQNSKAKIRSNIISYHLNFLYSIAMAEPISTLCPVDTSSTNEFIASNKTLHTVLTGTYNCFWVVPVLCSWNSASQSYWLPTSGYFVSLCWMRHIYTFSVSTVVLVLKKSNACRCQVK